MAIVRLVRKHLMDDEQDNLDQTKCRRNVFTIKSQMRASVSRLNISITMKQTTNDGRLI